MIYIVYFNFEELEKVLPIQCTKFIAHAWRNDFRINGISAYINFIDFVYNSYNKTKFIESLNTVESIYKFDFRENYNQKNSIVFVNYKSELEYVKSHTNLDIVTIVLHTEDTDLKQYNPDFLYLYTFGEYCSCKIPRIDKHNTITNFIKSNLYAV